MSPTLLLFIQVSLIVLIYGILAYVYTMLKSMKYLKSQKIKFEGIHMSLEVGKRVLLSCGLIGIISSIDQDIVKVRLNKELEVEASIYSVQSIL